MDMELLCWNSFFLVQPTQANTAVEWIHHTLCMLLLIERSMLSIFLWSTLIWNVNFESFSLRLNLLGLHQDCLLSFAYQCDRNMSLSLSLEIIWWYVIGDRCHKNAQLMSDPLWLVMISIHLVIQHQMCFGLQPPIASSLMMCNGGCCCIQHFPSHYGPAPSKWRKYDMSQGGIEGGRNWR